MEFKLEHVFPSITRSPSTIHPVLNSRSKPPSSWCLPRAFNLIRTKYLDPHYTVAPRPSSSTGVTAPQDSPQLHPFCSATNPHLAVNNLLFHIAATVFLAQRTDLETLEYPPSGPSIFAQKFQAPQARVFWKPQRRLLSMLSRMRRGLEIPRQVSLFCHCGGSSFLTLTKQQTADLSARIEQLEDLIERQRDDIKAANARIDTLAAERAQHRGHPINKKSSEAPLPDRGESSQSKESSSETGTDAARRADLEAREAALKQGEAKLKAQRSLFAHQTEKFAKEREALKRARETLDPDSEFETWLSAGPSRKRIRSDTTAVDGNKTSEAFNPAFGASTSRARSPEELCRGTQGRIRYPVRGIPSPSVRLATTPSAARW
ncbi:hypothetical protein C8R45DRAFT_1081138 [Mycena sanguinolenta]|nr:hypothetical protein C8R45DRAFT_1081138 [Mycena sanguinolenta]